MDKIHNTQFFEAVQEKKMDVGQVLGVVYTALTEKGYNPTYITNHNSARSVIMKVERDEILEELMSVYIDTRFKK